MTNTLSYNSWKTYRESELSHIVPLLEKYGYTLDADQPHTQGERFLMQAVTTTSGKKLILLGKRVADGKKVVIKGTCDTQGKQEITHERNCRRLLHTINFAYDTFYSPEELDYIEEKGCIISIQVFIEQKCTFLQRTLEQQFTFALRAFKAQESAHATTHTHFKAISKTFGSINAKQYLSSFDTFLTQTSVLLPDTHNTLPFMQQARAELKNNKKTIEQYSGFLTHTDFVPHNFRIQDNTMYLLDYSALRFGNKHEGWARFVNFMVLYNPPLARALLTYVKNNRAPEEVQSLWLMRLYRLGELISYYADKLEKCDGDLLSLNKARIIFWGKVLESTLSHAEVSNDVLVTYQTLRDTLRSADEKKRQINLH